MCPMHQSTSAALPGQARLQGAEEAGRAAHRERQAVAAQWDDALAALARCALLPRACIDPRRWLAEQAHSKAVRCDTATSAATCRMVTICGVAACRCHVTQLPMHSDLTFAIPKTSKCCAGGTQRYRQRMRQSPRGRTLGSGARERAGPRPGAGR